MFGNEAGQIDRDKIHRVHQHNPHEHRQRERGHETAIAVEDAFDLLVDKIEEQFYERLPAVRHAGRCAAHDPPEKSKSDYAEDNRGDQRIQMQRPERAITQGNRTVGEVMTDVFGWRQFASLTHCVSLNPGLFAHQQCDRIN